MSETTSLVRPHIAANEKLEYRIYFAMIWPFAVIAVLIGRLAPRRSAPGKLRRSILAEARDMAGMALPWVFSGR